MPAETSKTLTPEATPSSYKPSTTETIPHAAKSQTTATTPTPPIKTGIKEIEQTIEDLGLSPTFRNLSLAQSTLGRLKTAIAKKDFKTLIELGGLPSYVDRNGEISKAARRAHDLLEANEFIPKLVDAGVMSKKALSEYKRTAIIPAEATEAIKSARLKGLGQPFQFNGKGAYFTYENYRLKPYTPKENGRTPYVLASPQASGAAIGSTAGFERDENG
ncbi:MAG: hypothetical protein LBO72_05900, partial [Helicobacteraceae bacterium]|nr:hypothetical protein [Helicobacteraceae bacterium]